jgi:hypothetical protein
MPQDGKVLGSVTRPDPTIVFAEGNVEHPVDGVFDAPCPLVALSSRLASLSRLEM